MRKAFLITYSFVFFILLVIFSIENVQANKKKRSNKIKVLVIDGQSKNHKHWKEWTPILLKQLDASGLFEIDVATSPLKGESLDEFNPKFKNYELIINLYDGDNWSARTQRSLERYISTGGGLVIVHGADNAFPTWSEYNEMIGLGGWGDRTEAAGPYVYIDENGKTIRDPSPGPGGHHGPKHSFVVENRAPEHPIMKGIPPRWLHTEDELYDRLRGPAKNMTILATAFSSSEFQGTDRNEPILMTVEYEEGHVFHTTMGHHKIALSCVGFMTTFVRGCQWAANKQVTFEIPQDFPSESSVSKRTY